MRRLIAWSVAWMALDVTLMAARVVEYFASALLLAGDVTTLCALGASGALIGTGLAMRRVRLTEAADAEVRKARRTEFLRLRAPSPTTGQCPVCAMDDLDVLAERDRELELDGTPLVRVVTYGPVRAHQECAEAVPYVPPAWSTPVGARPHAHFGFYTPEPAAKWTYCGCDEMREEVVSPEKLAAKQRCVCKQRHAETGRPYLTVDRKALAAKPGRPHAGGYFGAPVTVEQMGPLPEALARAAGAPPVVNHTLRDSALKPPYLTRAGTYRATCAYCPWTRHLRTEGAGELAVREHARTCLKRFGVAAGKQPPEGWRQIGTLLAAAGGSPSSDPSLEVAMDIMSRDSDFNPGRFLVLVDQRGRAAEGGEILHSLSASHGALIAYVRVAGPLARVYPEGTGVFAQAMPQFPPVPELPPCVPDPGLTGRTGQ